MTRFSAVIVALLMLLSLSGQAGAHGMRTAYLELNENEQHAVYGIWKLKTPDTAARPVFPANCREPNKIGSDNGAGDAISRPIILVCDSGLRGQTLSIEGLGMLTNEAIVRIRLADGTVLSKLLTPAAADWRIPKDQSALEIAISYVGLGAKHILIGLDHLLFLLALILLVNKPVPLLVAVSSFTAAHMITLCASALHWINISSTAAEACIALTLIMVASNIADQETGSMKGKPSALLGFCFGLVHGLGFASALAEIGLPQDAIPLSLAFFNIGVELGQVAFILIVYQILKQVPSLQWQSRISMGGSYLVGITGAFLFFQRTWIII